MLCFNQILQDIRERVRECASEDQIINKLENGVLSFLNFVNFIAFCIEFTIFVFLR